MKSKIILITVAIAAFIACTSLMFAQVTPQEAEQLKSKLTPLGGERAGNADGSIPAWTGGMTGTPGYKGVGRRPDPFASEKPLYSITAQNMAQYANKLSEGTKAMFKKYPNTYRLDVYKTHRTAAAPQWVYDATYANATRAKLVPGDAGPQVVGAYLGTPFPIPHNGAEAIWNHLLRWRGAAFAFDMHAILIAADGKRVLTGDITAQQQHPNYFKNVPQDKYNGKYWEIRLVTPGPPIRAGEGIVEIETIDEAKAQSWVYLTGQRRVRKLPLACCDTPTPATAGVMSFDDLEVFLGRLQRFDWKLVGKKELYIPYNSNKTLQPTHDGDILSAHHLNPDFVRWELHRVWVVEATVAKGQRDQVAKSTYYLDEDTWMGVLADRYDSGGRLWKSNWMLPAACPDIPAQAGMTFGFYDLNSNTWYANFVLNESPFQYKIMPPWPESVFTPESLSNEGVR